MLVASDLALERPCSTALRIKVPEAGDGLGEPDEGGDAASASPGDPADQQCPGLGQLGLEDHAELFFEQVGSVDRAVVLGMAARVVRWSPVRSGGFFSSAHWVALIVVAWSARPVRRSWAASDRRTSSRALVAQATTGKASRHSTAFGARSVTTKWIHSAPSALTWVSDAARSGGEVVEELAQDHSGAVFARPHHPARCRDR